MSDVKLVEMRDNRKVLSKFKNSAGNWKLYKKWDSRFWKRKQRKSRTEKLTKIKSSVDSLIED